jgi:hypothetical protein
MREGQVLAYSPHTSIQIFLIETLVKGHAWHLTHGKKYRQQTCGGVYLT